MLGGAEPPRVPFGLAVVGLLFASAPAAVRGLFIRRGRVTGFGRACAWALAAGVCAGLILLRLRSYYYAEGG